MARVATGYSASVPELPDVEGFRRVVADHAANRCVESVEVHADRVVRTPGERPADEMLRGWCFAEPRRHGKWLLIATNTASRDGGPCLLVHFGMTGMLVWCEAGEQEHPHDRAIFHFAAGELRYRDQRKLTGIRITDNLGEAEDMIADLGPDAAEVTRQWLEERLTRRRRKMKQALMDQSVLAGLGNLSVDETLWRAHIAPSWSTTDLDEQAWKTLHRSMRSVLRESSRVGHIPDQPSWLTGHRYQAHPRCPRCSTRLRQDKSSGRTTVWCPNCQGG